MNRKFALLLVGAISMVGVALFAQNQGQGQAQGQNGQAQGQGGGQQTRGAQTRQASTQPPGAISGVVVSSTTGEPLRKVSLALQPVGRPGGGGQGGGPAATTTDNSGAFRFTNVEVGTYRLSGQRAGFVAGTYGQDRPGAQARDIEVTTGQTTNGIQLRLIPHSVIIGKVFDADGDPVQGAIVQVLRYTYPRGERQLSILQGGSSNDIGEYRIAGLAPGRYYVSAVRPPGALGGAVQALQDFANGGGPGALQDLLGGGRGAGKGGPGGPRQAQQQDIPEDYVTTYYPRTIEPGAATPIDLVPGSEARGIDIGLAKLRQYKISGVVDGVNLSDLQSQNQAGAQAKGKQKGKGGGGFGGVGLQLVPRTAQAGLGALINRAGGGNAQVDPSTGRFEFRGVAPGAYYILAQTRGPAAQNRLSGRVPVDVGGSNLDNITVRMTPPLQVKGTIAPDKADSTLNLKNLRLTFTAASPAGGPGGGGRGGPGGPNNGRIDIADNGTFQTEMDADTYTVEVAGAPTGYYLKAVKLAGRESPDTVLDLSYNGAQVDVVLASGAGNITGTVTNAKGDSPGRVLVSAVPVSGSKRNDLNKSTNTDDDGTFTISNLPPGKYKIFAWEEIEANSWRAPEFRQPFESLATSAEVTNGAGGTVTLKVISREQTAGK